MAFFLKYIFKFLYVLLISAFTLFAETGSNANVGTDFMLPCNISSKISPEVSWLKDGKLLFYNSSDKTYRHPVMTKAGLLFSPVLPSDSGNFTCFISNQYEFQEITTELLVKTPPAKLANVSVHPSTVVATVRWHVQDDGGYPITNFTLIYRQIATNGSESWHTPPPMHISPAARQFFVYQLKPDTNYTFKIWATNKLGHGEAVSIQASTVKGMDPPEVFRKILADAENFGSTAWLLVFCMLAVTVLILLLISCSLVIREQRIGIIEETVPHIITNPGFEIDMEQCYLLEHADFNDNIEKPLHLNNNTVVLPSRV